jgi:DNA-binding SARP family transcriptional activator
MAEGLVAKLRVRLLGPVEISDEASGTKLYLHSARARKLLALLANERDRFFLDELVEQLWTEERYAEWAIALRETWRERYREACALLAECEQRHLQAPKHQRSCQIFRSLLLRKPACVSGRAWLSS